MPGEQLEDALAAAERLKLQSISTVFTHLGENVANEGEARIVSEQYLQSLDEIQKHGLDSCISLKLTHLGLDLRSDTCLQNLKPIIQRAEALKKMVWIDIEQSQYVDRTIAIFKAVRDTHANVGLCLQAYLHRTERDLEDLLPLAPAIRLVKGAYKEPPSVAIRRKADVDANFYRLAKTLLENVGRGAVAAIATHDMRLVRTLAAEGGRLGLSKSTYEFQMLYGIQAAEQLRLAQEGYRMRVLISYGSYWFPWYVRRLAERPANMFFVIRNLFSS